MVTTKAKNPTDLTLRNLRAERRRNKKLTERLEGLEARVEALETRARNDALLKARQRSA